VLQRPLEGPAQVRDACGLRIVRVVREHLEDAAPDDLVARRHRRAEVRVAHRDDPEVRRQHEVGAAGGLEESAKVGRFLGHGPPPAEVEDRPDRPGW